jgi:hypothetical protein
MRVILVGLLASLWFAGGVQAEPVRQDATGMVFPDKVGEFKRIAVHRYDAEGRNVSAGYNLRLGDAGVAVTVYVYPLEPRAGETARQACDRDFAGVTRAIVAANPENEAMGETAVQGSVGAETVAGRMAAFTYSQNFAQALRTVTTRALVLCPVKERWIVKYRATWPADQDGEAPFEAFRAALPLTIAPSP